MLDNEVRAILQEQFSMERNYQKVMRNVNKRQTLYGKILKYAIVPTCVIVLVAIVITNINTNSNEHNEIAQINNVKENNEIIEENPTIQVEKGKNNDNMQIAQGEIYKTIQGEEASWAYDATIPENLINDRKESKYVVKAKILSVGEGEMLPKQENFYNPFTCHTPIKMKIVDNLLSENKLSGTITAYITGGKMKIANILENATKQEVEYMGIYDVSQVDKEKYIEYIWSESYYEPIVGDEYVIIIGKANANLYQVCCGGYGIFKVEKLNNQERYTNVVTNKEWKIE